MDKHKTKIINQNFRHFCTQSWSFESNLMPSKSMFRKEDANLSLEPKWKTQINWLIEMQITEIEVTVRRLESLETSYGIDCIILCEINIIKYNSLHAECEMRYKTCYIICVYTKDSLVARDLVMDLVVLSHME